MTFSIRPTITFKDNHWEIFQQFSQHSYIRLQAHTPLELSTILFALGTGKISPQEETMEEFLARGGVIIRPKKIMAEKNICTLSLEELLS